MFWTVENLWLPLFSSNFNLRYCAFNFSCSMALPDAPCQVLNKLFATAPFSSIWNHPLPTTYLLRTALPVLQLPLFADSAILFVFFCLVTSYFISIVCFWWPWPVSCFSLPFYFDAHKLCPVPSIRVEDVITFGRVSHACTIKYPLLLQKALYSS